MQRQLSKFLPSALALATAALVAACGGGSAEAPDVFGPRATITAAAQANLGTGTDGAALATGSVVVTFSFSEDVGRSFTADDVVVTGATAGTFTRVSGTSATLELIPPANSSGTLQVTLPLGRVSDAAGNTNTADPSFALLYNTGTVTPPVSGATGTCTAEPCLDFTAATIAYAGFGGATGVQDTDPADATNKVARIVKAAGAEVWGGVTIATTASNNSVAPAGFATSKIVTLRVYSPAAGKTIKIKFEDAADGTRSVETDATTTGAGAWETLTFDLATPSAGTAAFNAAYTYNKVSVFVDFGNSPAADATYYIDELKYAAASTTPAVPSGATGTCTTAPCLDFTSATIAYAGFGGATGVQDTDPADATNKVARLVKAAGGEVWGGVTIATTAADNSVATANFASSKIVTLRVYSPAVGEKVKIKFEDAADGTRSVETDATTTVAGAWETLTFDLASPSAGTAAFNAAYTYNKVSVFPAFGNSSSADAVYYIDELKYTGATSGGSGAAAVFASGYTSGGGTAQGGGWGYYSGDFSDYANTYTGGGFADSTPPVPDASQYFYLTVTTSAPTAPQGGASPTSGGYLGMYVTYPGGGLSVADKTNLLVNLGVDANFFQQASNKNITVLMVGATVYGNGSGGNCQITLQHDVTPTTADMVTYTVPLSSFTMTQNCNAGGFTSGVTSVAQALALPIGAVNTQLSFPNVNTTVNSGTVGAPVYATGLTRGKTEFQ